MRLVRLVNYELERMRKELAIPQFEDLFKNVSRGTEKSHEIPWLG
jgi:hypothetical protein